MLFDSLARRQEWSFKRLPSRDRIIADWRCLVFSLCALLLGCAQQGPTGDGLPNQGISPDDILPDSEPEVWEARGKMAVRVGEEGGSFNFHWQITDGEQHDLEVWGPLGRGRTRFVGTSEALTISQGGEVVAAGPALSIMQHYLNFSLPLPVLQRWLQGRTSAGTTVPDPGNGEASFTDLGWTIELSRYRDEPPVQPMRMVLNHAAGPVETRIRVILGQITAN